MNPGETPASAERSKNLPLYLAISCVAFLILLPTLAAIFYKPSAAEWTGLLSRNTSDLNVYISFTEQTRSGAYLSKNLFTAEPHGPFILRPSYFLLGLIGRLAPGISPVTFIETSRLAAAFTLLLVFTAFARKLFQQVS